MGRVALATLGCTAALAGCGSTAARHTAPPSCTNRAASRATARILLDIAALRRASALPTKSALKGNPAVNRATDAFLHDVETAPIGNLARNRLIDHAAAALVGACEQCFQALEAARPIPEIAHRGSACTK